MDDNGVADGPFKGGGVSMRGVVVAILAGMLSAGCSVFGIRTTEEPAYTVERQVGGAEIRRYGPRVAAETVVTGDALAARRVGFERLAGYIFGGNAGSQRIAMTAPVAQEGGTKIAMTAPVDQAPVGDAWRIRFFMPAAARLESLPEPNDRSVSLVRVPGEVVAVWRYSGVPSVAAVRAGSAALLAALAQGGVATEGAVFSWFYDPPWTLPPLRRNEAVVRLRSE